VRTPRINSLIAQLSCTGEDPELRAELMLVRRELKLMRLKLIELTAPPVWRFRRLLKVMERLV
jgi:hypothetical protein